MKKIIPFLCITILFLAYPITEAEDFNDDRGAVNDAFGVGELLVYNINWQFVNAGVASLQVGSITELRGEKCYHIRSTANSNKTISYLYKVNDLVESFIHQKSLYPLRFEKHLQEGNYEADKSVVFDQQRHIAIYPDDTFDIPINAQDILSSMYYLRTFELEVGDTISIPTHADEENYPLDVIVHKRESIEVKSGKFECFMVEPLLKTPGVFKQEGRIKVWLTANETKMPVLMKSKVLIGAVKATLKDYKKGAPPEGTVSEF